MNESTILHAFDVVVIQCVMFDVDHFRLCFKMAVDDSLGCGHSLHILTTNLGTSIYCLQTHDSCLYEVPFCDCLF